MDAYFRRDLLELCCVAKSGVNVSVVLDRSTFGGSQPAPWARNPKAFVLGCSGRAPNKIVVGVVDFAPSLGDQLIVEAATRLGLVPHCDPDLAFHVCMEPVDEEFDIRCRTSPTSCTSTGSSTSCGPQSVSSPSPSGIVEWHARNPFSASDQQRMNSSSKRTDPRVAVIGIVHPAEGGHFRISQERRAPVRKRGRPTGR